MLEYEVLFCDLSETMIVVTKHPNFVTYLKEIGLLEEGAKVMTRVDENIVKGQHVVGVLPHHLSSKAEMYTEVPLYIPPPLKGMELSIEQIRAFASTPRTYKITQISDRTTTV